MNTTKQQTRFLKSMIYKLFVLLCIGIYVCEWIVLFGGLDMYKYTQRTEDSDKYSYDSMESKRYINLINKLKLPLSFIKLFSLNMILIHSLNFHMHIFSWKYCPSASWTLVLGHEPFWVFDLHGVIPFWSMRELRSSKIFHPRARKESFDPSQSWIYTRHVAQVYISAIN